MKWRGYNVALKDKLEQEQSLSELLNETQELNRLMTSYIRVQMNEDMNRNMGKIESNTENLINEAMKETKTLVSKAKKGAMAAYWGDAFKYGLATSVIAVPIILVVEWFIF